MFAPLLSPPDAKRASWRWARSAQEAGLAGLALGEIARTGNRTLKLGPYGAGWPTHLGAGTDTFTAPRQHLRVLGDRTALAIRNGQILPWAIHVSTPHPIQAVAEDILATAPTWAGTIATQANHLTVGDTPTFWAPIATQHDLDPRIATLVHQTVCVLLGAHLVHQPLHPYGMPTLDASLDSAFVAPKGTLHPPVLHLRGHELHTLTRAIPGPALDAWIAAFGHGLWACAQSEGFAHALMGGTPLPGSKRLSGGPVFGHVATPLLNESFTRDAMLGASAHLRMQAQAAAQRLGLPALPPV